MAELKESIKKNGILVPLTVYWDEDVKHYVILDGQRRWTCATDLKLQQVPVNEVAKPTLIENIVTMFQIHRLREDWELMPTALTLEVLMKAIKDKNDKRLAVITGLDVAVVVRCKKLLSYPKKYQELMLDPDPDQRIKADFFIELYAVRNDRTVNSFSWFSKNRFTKQMLDKYLNKKSGLKAVTDFRLMKQYISNATKAGKKSLISERLRQFCINDALTLEYLNIRSAGVSANAKKLSQLGHRIINELHAIDAGEYVGEEKFWKTLEELLTTIRRKLKDADRRLAA
jgi:ParB/RepB/Spo0J family partition protein